MYESAVTSGIVSKVTEVKDGKDGMMDSKKVERRIK